MTIWSISLQNIKSKPLYSFLSISILALSIALLLGIQQLESSFKYQMENNLGEIDLVIGAKGSPLQLVLSSVLHLDNPTGNILYEDAKRISKNPLIKTAVPISYGDNYKGYRIVGTSNEYVNLYNAKLEDGRFPEKPMEVVLGHTVAKQLNLRLGNTFLSSHGLVENNIEIHTERLKVVGILKPTQKVIDRLIVTNLESIWEVHHHEEEHSHKHENQIEHHKNHIKEKEITSLLISFRNPVALLSLTRSINEQTNMQAALPKYELQRLHEYTGVGIKTLSWIAYMILIISCGTIFISLYKMVKEHAFDLALLRTYGASNFQLIKMVTYEAVIIGILATTLGFILSKLGLQTLFKIVSTGNKQYMLQQLPLQEFLYIISVVFTMIITAMALAIYPIIKMNISAILSHEK